MTLFLKNIFQMNLQRHFSCFFNAAFLKYRFTPKIFQNFFLSRFSILLFLFLTYSLCLFFSSPVFAEKRVGHPPLSLEKPLKNQILSTPGAPIATSENATKTCQNLSPVPHTNFSETVDKPEKTVGTPKPNPGPQPSDD